MIPLVSDSKESSGAISTTVRSAFPPSCAKDRTSTSKQQWTNTIPTAAFPYIDGFRVFPKAQDFRKNTEPIFPFHETFGRHVEYQSGNAPNHVISLADTGAIMAERKRPLQPYERIPDNAGARTSLYFPCLCIRERHIPLGLKKTSLPQFANPTSNGVWSTSSWPRSLPSHPA